MTKHAVIEYNFPFWFISMKQNLKCIFQPSTYIFHIRSLLGKHKTIFKRVYSYVTLKGNAV